MVDYAYEFTNNAQTRLAVAVSSTSQTTITVTSGDGALFPTLTGDGSDYFTITVVKADGSREIMMIVNRSTDALTVGVPGSGSANSSGRGYEGTTETTFSIDDVVELRLTAGAIGAWIDQIQANATAITAQATAVKTSFPGSFGRSKFDYKGTTDIYVGAGWYHHQGTSEQIVYCDSQLTYSFSSLGVSDWSYLYIDDSAVVTAGTNLLSATELTDSTTEPTWSESKHGWYNGSDRCIFAVLTDGSSQILEFHHLGDFILFDEDILNISQDIDTTWTDVTLSVPVITRSAEACLVIDDQTDITSPDLFWRVNGSSGTGHWVQEANYLRSTDLSNTMRVICDATGKIEIKHSASTDAQSVVNTNGWYLGYGV